MQRPSDQLLTGTALSRDQDRGVTFRHSIDERKESLDGITLTNDRAEPEFGSDQPDDHSGRCRS